MMYGHVRVIYSLHISLKNVKGSIVLAHKNVNTFFADTLKNVSQPLRGAAVLFAEKEPKPPSLLSRSVTFNDSLAIFFKSNKEH